MRYFLYLSYKGTNYHGWQIQDNANSVQQEISQTLSTILRQPTEIVGSGRTDTGVHALQQVAHFDHQENTDLGNLLYKLNSLLPSDIAIDEIRPVADQAHARFDAIERSYVYRITTIKDPFEVEGSYYFRQPLDLQKMNDLKPILVEWKDFQSFSKVKTEVNHFECDVKDIHWSEENKRIVFTVSANRFLRGMVRAMVGTMLEVGLGKMGQSEFIEILESRDRRKAGEAVPPHGLFLQSIKYPEEIFI